MAEPVIFADHYAALGISVDSTPKEICSAFRKRALLHHPDVSKDDGMEFMRIYSAYRVLSNNATRKIYDRSYQLLFRRSSPGPSTTPTPINIPSTRLVFPENAVNLARNGLLRKGVLVKDRRRLLRIDYDMELPLNESEIGKRIRLSVPLTVRRICPECMGSDIECYACSGKGTLRSIVTVRILIEAGLVYNQIVELDLRKFKLNSMDHFKKSRVRIRITRMEKKAGNG